MSRKKLVTLLAAAALVTGCKSRLTGNEGNLEFSYVADDALTDFNKPIAVGAKLDVEVAEVGTRRAVTLQKATSDDAAVLAIAGFSGNKLTLEGKSSGSALIEVEAKRSDDAVVTDSVNMLARVPEVLKLRHTCASGAEAAYLVDHEFLVPFDMEMKNGQPVIGYGYHPVELLPQGALTLDATTKDQSSLHLKSGKERMEATVKSTLDATSLKLFLVQPGDVDAAVLEGPTQAGTEIGKSNLFLVRPKVGERMLCQPTLALTAASTTPEICEVKAANTGGDVNENPENKHGWVQVTGKKLGKCEFTVTYAAAKGGAGLTSPFTADIIEVKRPQ
ncbi:MAG: hypothetical protein ACK4N5_19965 [Myxococcales bacterium]